MLNCATCACECSEEEKWVGWVSRIVFFFCRRMTHMKTKQSLAWRMWKRVVKVVEFNVLNSECENINFEMFLEILLQIWNNYKL